MNKAQVKMFESVAVLIVFFFLLVFGMSFFFVLQRASQERELDRIAQLKSIQIAQKTMFLAELDCVFIGVQIENCFDELKIKNFVNLINSSQQAIVDYFNVFEFSTINIVKVFPGDNETITLYSRPREGRGFSVTQIPILLFNPITKVYSYSYLEVISYA